VVERAAVVNAVLSFMQERRAAASSKRCGKGCSQCARAARGGVAGIPPGMVPGDIVRVAPGHHPGRRETPHRALSVGQCALTGESKDVAKAPAESSRRICVRPGEGTCGNADGGGNLLCRTTELVQEARPKLHIEPCGQGVRWLSHRRRAVSMVVVMC